MKDEILARMYVVLTLLALVPLLVAIQVVRVTVFQGADLRARGAEQANSQVSVPAMRGTIVDRAGRTLAVNTARYDIAVDPTVSGFDDAAGALFDRLTRITGTPAVEYRRRVRDRSSRQYVLLARGVDESIDDGLGEFDIPGLIITARFSRRYSYGTTAAHVLGHVNSDLVGIAGIESVMNATLTGEPGRRSVQRDRLGVLKATAGGIVVDPRHGETVVLTIDLVRQAALEEELRKGVLETGANWGTAIAMDPRNGEILAMANYPTYDPNRAGSFAESVRRNHAVADYLEPGSTFKLVAAAAAIEQGLVALDDTIDTGPGWRVVHGVTLHDTHPYGRIPFIEVIAQSSNIGIARVADRIERGLFYRYARSLGFGMPTWIDVPGEVAGSLKKPSAWSGTTLTSMSRGYEVEATPLQLLVAYGALANNGTLVQPHIVAEHRDVTGAVTWTASPDSIRRAFLPATAKTLIPAFERAVESGTGVNARVDGVRIAGKTGTAWKTRDGAYLEGAYRASFVGFFPVEAPRVVLVVILDEPERSVYGGLAAAPVFRETVQRWLSTMPDAVELAVAAPEPTLRETPAAQRQPAERTDRMPDLTGRSVRYATTWLTELGVRPRIEGNGVVRSQSPAAGAALPEEAVLRCR